MNAFRMFFSDARAQIRCNVLVMRFLRADEPSVLRMDLKEASAVIFAVRAADGRHEFGCYRLMGMQHRRHECHGLRHAGDGPSEKSQFGSQMPDRMLVNNPVPPGQKAMPSGPDQQGWLEQRGKKRIFVPLASFATRNDADTALNTVGQALFNGRHSNGSAIIRGLLMGASFALAGILVLFLVMGIHTHPPVQTANSASAPSAASGNSSRTAMPEGVPQSADQILQLPQ